MSTITREQAKDLRNAFQCWQQDYDPTEDKEQYDMFGLGMVAMDALLASLEAEAAYFINRVKHSDAYGDDVELRTYCYELDALKSKDDFGGEVVPVYTAPPAPSVDEDLLHMAASAIDDLLSNKDRPGAGVWAGIPAKLRRAAMLQGAGGNSPVIPGCSCRNCRPVTMTDMRFVVCPVCGNKRCPHANDHRNACTGSNEPGQEGSAYPAAPQQA